MGNDLYRILNFSNERKIFVLNNNFDDIKSSEYINDIIKDWECAGFTRSLEGEKKVNCSIALDQLMSFLNFADLKFVIASFPIDFSENIYRIFANVYQELPLSDYDYNELYTSFLNIMKDTLTIHEIEEYMKNSQDKEQACIDYISEKIIEEIKNK